MRCAGVLAPWRGRGSGVATYEHLTFAAAIEKIKERTAEKLTALVRQCSQDVIADAQTPVAAGGRMPVDTGFLRNSLTTSLNGGGGVEGGDNYVAKIAEAEPGDIIDARWTAEYAAAVEYGHAAPYDAGGPLIVQPRFYARGAVEKWPQIVERNARALERQ